MRLLTSLANSIQNHVIIKLFCHSFIIRFIKSFLFQTSSKVREYKLASLNESNFFGFAVPQHLSHCSENSLNYSIAGFHFHTSNTLSTTYLSCSKHFCCSSHWAHSHCPTNLTRSAYLSCHLFKCHISLFAAFAANIRGRKRLSTLTAKLAHKIC